MVTDVITGTDILSLMLLAEKWIIKLNDLCKKFKKRLLLDASTLSNFIASGDPSPEHTAQILTIVHNLAGISEILGFHSLSLEASEIEDLVTKPDEMMRRATHLVERMFAIANRNE